MSLLVLMGSGETAPAMTQTHREILGRTGVQRPVVLDTPFGFQVNAEDLVRRTRKYFKEAVGISVDVASWPSRDMDAVNQEANLTRISRADWLFCGPGSPTYALDHWRDTPVPAALDDLLRRNGVLILGGAAAVTVGSHALPVYEIYKVGAAPHWVDGLNLMSTHVGLNVAVIPHFNNAEGGSYDTRYCYLGEQRLQTLERQLPEDAAVLGIDEHTATVFDLAARTAEVYGNGALTVRRERSSQQLAAGQVVSFEQLVAMSAEGRQAATTLPVRSQAEDASRAAGEQPSLDAELRRSRTRFDASLDAKDIEGCLSAFLSLEQAIHEWSTDMLQSDETDRARRELRSMAVRLADVAKRGAVDPREAIRPYVDALVEIRSRARYEEDFATSDLIREQLASAGISLRDTPSGPSWQLVRNGEPSANNTEPH